MSYNHQWVMRMWYIYAMEYYLVVKKDKIINFAGDWTELEKIVLSEVTQTRNQTGHVLSYWRLLVPNLQM